MNNTKYINNYIGTFPIEIMDKVRSIVSPIVKKYKVGLRGRGRGSRELGKQTYYSPFYKRDMTTNNYQGYLPLKHSTEVSFYIRVEPTDQFLKEYKIGTKENWKVCQQFEEWVSPTVRDEIREELIKHGIIRVR